MSISKQDIEMEGSYASHSDDAPRHPDKIVADYLARYVAALNVPMIGAIASSNMAQNPKIISIAFFSGVGLRFGSIASKGFKDFNEFRPRYDDGEIVPPGIAKTLKGRFVNLVGAAVAAPLLYHAQKSGLAGNMIRNIPLEPNHYLAIVETAVSGAALSVTQGVSTAIRGHSFDRSFG